MQKKILVPPHLKFDYLPALAFQSKKERQNILTRGLAELEKGNIPEQALQLGEKYREIIESRYEPRATVRYINRRVGYGVFSEEDFLANSYIGEYTGIVRENIRVYFAPLNNYCYEYPVPDHLGRSFVIDGTKGNFTRFINHSSRPNLKAHHVFYDGFYHVILIALRDIQKGEQLSYEYGARYWYIRTPPIDL